MTLFILLVLTAGQDEIGFEAKEGEDGALLVAGCADLPDGARISITIRGGAAAESPELHSEIVRIRAGEFSLRARIFPGRALPGPYDVVVRYDQEMQDRLEVLKRLREAGRATSRAVEKRVWIGSREAFESGLGEARRRVADAMSEMLRLTRAAYEACRRNPQDPRVGRSLEALRLEIVEIERNHDKRPELRFYGLADVAEVGLENLRERAWVILDRLSISIASGKSPELPHSALAALEDRIGDYCEQLGLGRGGGRKTRAILESMRNRIAALGASKDLEAEIAALRADSLELAHSATRTEYAAVAELIEKIERWASGPLRDRDSGGILKDLDRALAAWGNR